MSARRTQTGAVSVFVEKALNLCQQFFHSVCACVYALICHIVVIAAVQIYDYEREQTPGVRSVLRRLIFIPFT